jgi:hypothetical protein
MAVWIMVLAVLVLVVTLLVVVAALVMRSNALSREIEHQHPAIRDPDWIDADKVGQRPKHVAVRDPDRHRRTGS